MVYVYLVTVIMSQAFVVSTMAEVAKLKPSLCTNNTATEEVTA